MELSEAGIEAARKARGNMQSPRSASTRVPTIEEVVRAYLDAAGFRVEAEMKTSGSGDKRKRASTGRKRMVGPWQEPTP